MEIAILIISIITLMFIIGLTIKVSFFKQRESEFSQQKIIEEIKAESKITAEKLALVTKASSDAVFSGIRDNNSAIITRVVELTSSNEKNLSVLKEDIATRLFEIKQGLQSTLKEVREDNSAQLEKIRHTVDEKLNETLSKRLTESFNTIAERLEAVNKGLGEMQALASNVVDLKKVMTNVKTRGVWGEVSLETLLENILATDQYEKNCNVSGKGSLERVDFAIILPGDGARVYLPIDVKFPIEAYQRIVEASEIGDKTEIENATKELIAIVRKEAMSIKSKYIKPPTTTDFAIMYLPTEGLYAEVIKTRGLAEELQNKYNIIPSGPTNFSALLNSLQMGFRTLAIQKSTKEVFKLFSAFQKDIGMFLNYLEKAQEQIGKAAENLDSATRKTTDLQKRMNKVEQYSLENEVNLLD